MNKWRAEPGDANIILKALVDFFTATGIEIIPRYVRSEHNMESDYVTGRTDRNAIEWGEKTGFRDRGCQNGGWP